MGDERGHGLGEGFERCAVGGYIETEVSGMESGVEVCVPPGLACWVPICVGNAR